MKSDRLIGLALLAVQCGLLGFLARSSGFPAFVMVVALIGVLTRFRFGISRERGMFLSLVLAVLFLIKHRISPVEFSASQLFIRTQLAHEVARYLVLMQALQFLIRRDRDELPAFLPVLGGMAMVFGMNVNIASEQRPLTQWLSIAYVLLWGLYLNAVQRRHELRAESLTRRRWLLSTITLLIIAIATTITASGLYRFERRIERYIVEWLLSTPSTSQTGFSDTSRLGSVQHQKSENENDVALRVYAEREPGYFRGMVYASFVGSEWRSSTRLERFALSPVQPPPEGFPGGYPHEELYAYPALTLPDPPRWERYECWPTEKLEGIAFTPLGTTHLGTGYHDVRYRIHGLFDIGGQTATTPYAAWLTDGRRPRGDLTDDDREKYLWLAEQYRKELKQLADGLFVNCTTTDQKLAAVQRFFRDGFEYRLGIDIPENENALVYFLTEKPPAHCEFFATGTAILLKYAGVPCRYVTGFVAAERNSFGEFWLARNRDAHAWVEAYNEEAGRWVTVDNTPGEGVPTPRESATLGGYFDHVKAAFARLQLLIGQQRWGEALGLIGRGLRTVPGMLIALLLIVWLAKRLPRPRWFQRTPPSQESPRDRAFRDVLGIADDWLSRYGLTRDPLQTLHQFADGIESVSTSKTEPVPLTPEMRGRIANWYREYAGLRYGPQTSAAGDEEMLAELARNWHAIVD